MDECPICGGKLTRKSETEELGTFEFDECRKCGERFYFEDVMSAIDEAKRKEFEKRYAERSGLPPETFYKLGLRAYPCNCGDEKCEGWQVLHAHGYKLAEALGRFSRKTTGGK